MKKTSIHAKTVIVAKKEFKKSKSKSKSPKKTKQKVKKSLKKVKAVK